MSSELDIGIQVKGLVKKFKPHQYTGAVQVTAVDKVDLKVYKGQTTALLGHNAAGKSTLISLITCLYPPTEGSIFIDGVDQLKNMNTRNTSIGICPQYNLLFEDLTVEEHLTFFAQLKNVKCVKVCVKQTLEELKLLEYRDVKAGQLSGGYKRKLSVGIALVGDPDVLILDEPTSGMDYIAKSLTWDILSEKKSSNRTILLTTHNMDDAEKADRIAIMVEGKLACSGTPNFLKKRYGVGYNLRIQMSSDEYAKHIDGIVTFMCQKHEKYRIGLELQFLLPYEEMHNFSHLFEQLEKCQKDNKIKSFSVQENRMTDIFINVREGRSHSWNALRNGFFNRAPARNSHPRVIPSMSIGSFDINMQFEGTDGKNLKAIDEEDYSQNGYPVSEHGINRTMSYMRVPSAAPSSRERSNSFGSSTRTITKKHETPSILQSVFTIEEEQSEEGIDSTNINGFVTSKTNVWIQQYKAMLLKRYYNFVRFRVGFIWQFVFPLLFIFLGLLLAVIIPATHSNDPKRKITLSESAPEEDIRVFWGDFSSSKANLPFNVDELSSSIFGSPSVENITDEVYGIYHEVKDEPINDTIGCCDYEFQILDTFCAQKTKNELKDACSTSTKFGYSRCLDRCLSCCEAKAHQLPSCSNLRFQQIDSLINQPVASNFCPTPPKLPTSSNDSSSLQGLDVFVNELLLRKASKQLSVFFKRYMGGFTILETPPLYTTCQCGNQPHEDTILIDSLNFLISNSQCHGKTPIFFPSFCNESKIIRMFTSNLTSALHNYNIQNDHDTEDMFCLPTLMDLEETYNCSSFCTDDTCSSCDCSSNQSLNSWYGDTLLESGSVIIWYNNEHYHISPAMLSVFHNAYLQDVSDGKYSITVYNHPLPRTSVVTAETVQADVIIFAIGLLSSFGFSFLVASYALYIVHEVASKAKHLQYVSGLYKSAYWTANLTWDMLGSLLPVFVAFLMFGIFQITWLPHFSNLSLLATLFLLILHCWAEVPLTYLISLGFTNIYTAYTSIFILNSMSTLSFLSLVYLIRVIADNEMAADVLHYFFLLNPSYGLASGLSDIYYNHVVKSSCEKSAISLAGCRENNVQYFEQPFELGRPGIGLIVIFLFTEGLLFAALTILVDHLDDIWQFVERKKKWTLKMRHEHARKKVQDVKNETRNTIRPLSSYTERGESFRNEFSNLQRSVSLFEPQRPGLRRSFSRVPEDISVKRERKNVSLLFNKQETRDLKDSDYSLVLSAVSKQYHTGPLKKLKEIWTQEEPPLPAVADVTLKVTEKECFGLAGFNGAGKTTIFKILTGDISSTSGVTTICGLNISSHFNEVRKKLGYCPQFDALIERMTGREILTMYARIKGLDKKTTQLEVKEKLHLLNLDDHADKLCWKYSGGNKRKLSAAIALIGDPKVVLLDEPTTGMDIETRGRFINMLKKHIEKKKTSVILTSHSISECEAVCNRIGILIKGEFRCIGGTEELKNKYGEQKTKVVIRVENYIPTPHQSELSSQHSLATNVHYSQPLRRTPSIYKRLQSFSKVISTSNVVGNPPIPTIVIEEENESSSEDEYDEVDNTEIRRIPVQNPEPEVSEAEDDLDYVNRYLLKACMKFEKEFSTLRTIKKIGFDLDEVTYKLPRTVPLSRIFLVMERMKKHPDYHIQSYSVSQSTLEQVYHFFANEQKQQ